MQRCSASEEFQQEVLGWSRRLYATQPGQLAIIAPKSKSREAIVIDMPEPMDHATFARGVTVENAQGTVILGEITFAQHETRATFVPQALALGAVRLVHQPIG